MHLRTAGLSLPTATSALKVGKRMQAGRGVCVALALPVHALLAGPYSVRAAAAGCPSVPSTATPELPPSRNAASAVINPSPLPRCRRVCEGAAGAAASVPRSLQRGQPRRRCVRNPACLGLLSQLPCDAEGASCRALQPGSVCSAGCCVCDCERFQFQPYHPDTTCLPFSTPCRLVLQPL